MDWNREKTVTAREMSRFTEVVQKFGGLDKLTELLETLQEEERKIVSRE